MKEYDGKDPTFNPKIHICQCILELCYGEIRVFRAPEPSNKRTIVPIRSHETVVIGKVYKFSLSHKEDSDFSAFVSFMTIADYNNLCKNKLVARRLQTTHRRMSLIMKQSLPILVTKERKVLALPYFGIYLPNIVATVSFEPVFPLTADTLPSSEIQ